MCVALGCGVHHQARAITASVVHQDQLVIDALTVEVPLDLLDGAGQPLLLVVAGDDDAEHDPPSYLPALRTLIAKPGRTTIRRILHGWFARRGSHPRPALRIHTGARGARPARESNAPRTPN